MVSRVRRLVVSFLLTFLLLTLTFDLFRRLRSPRKNTPVTSHANTTVFNRSDSRVPLFSFATGSRLSELSFNANSIQRRIQQLVCSSRDHRVTSSDTGGWCDAVVGREHRTDNALVEALSTHLFGSRVVGLGEGLGHYRTLVLQTGLVDIYDAFDGSPFIDELTKGQVRFLDLALPQFWLPVYDWAVCLEVLEHIPGQFESVAVDNVVRVARIGVVLSWARPGQGGLGHVNTRPQDYVDALMTQRGFDLDVVTSGKLRDAATFAWFKFTLNVYRRTNESIRFFDAQNGVKNSLE